MTFGEKIQKLRKEADLSQEELACQLGVSRQAVSKWERDSGYPETEKIIHMSRLFNVTLDYLLNEENSGGNQNSAPPRTEEEKGESDFLQKISEKALRLPQKHFLIHWK